MALISKSAEYGLRAILYVAGRAGSRYVSIREVSRELDISFHFLTKTLQKLTRAGLLQSFRGPSGGVALARPAETITLLDIAEAIETRKLFTSFVLGLAGCGERKPCPLHAAWAVERRRLKAMFKKPTLASLARPVARGQLRLAD
jgi:Rrf2 family iron-sulfur cluster assembly transcriptional regulator